MKNRKTPLECCQTLPMLSIVKEIGDACKKDRQRKEKFSLIRLFVRESKNMNRDASFEVRASRGARESSHKPG
jgi:hypothetical protein